MRRAERAACLSPQQIFEQCIRGCCFLGPNETTTFELVTGQSGESTLNGTEAKSGRHFMVTVTAPATKPDQHLSVDFVDGAWIPSASKVANGPVRLAARNSSDRRIFVTVVEFPDAAPHCCSILDFEPHLTAKRVLTTQTFRDLFRAEQIKGTEGIGVRDITLVFTDLKGSTELYERIGDLNALALVQQHFERLTDVTVRHDGAIIKTLGDAVMAAFMKPVDAVKAALAMRSEIARFNASRTEPDLILKVGLHRGAAIAVAFNDRLDYFGQSVNIAARVEALANGGDICLTREVQDAPDVQTILAPYLVSTAPARLKGVHDEVPVWRIHETGTVRPCRCEDAIKALGQTRTPRAGWRGICGFIRLEVGRCNWSRGLRCCRVETGHKRQCTMPFGLRAKLEDLPFACPQCGARNHRDFYMAGCAAVAQLKNPEQFS